MPSPSEDSPAPSPPRPLAPGAVRRDIVLRRLAWQTVQAEQLRRGTGISETIGSLICEWRLLTRIQDAAAFRREMRDDVAVARRGGPQAAAALNRIRDRVVLVTAL